MNWSSWSIWSPKQTGVRGGDQSRWSSGWVTIPSRRTLRSRHRPYSHYTSLHIVTIRAPTGEHGVCLFIFSSRLLPELRQASPVIPRSQLTIGTSRHRRMCKHHPEVWLLLWAHKFECDSYVWYMKHINIYTYIYTHLNLMKSEKQWKEVPDNPCTQYNSGTKHMIWRVWHVRTFPMCWDELVWCRSLGRNILLVKECWSLRPTADEERERETSLGRWYWDSVSISEVVGDAVGSLNLL